MILGVEVAMALMGLYALVAGRLPMSPGRVVRGAPARCLGLVCLLPVPLTFGLAFCLGLVLGLLGVRHLPKDTRDLIGLGLEIFLSLGTAALVAFLGHRLGDPARGVVKRPLGDFDPWADPGQPADWVEFGAPSPGRKIFAWTALGVACLALVAILAYRLWPRAEEERPALPVLAPPLIAARPPMKAPARRPAARDDGPDGTAVVDVPKGPRPAVSARKPARSKAPGAGKSGFSAAPTTRPESTGAGLADRPRSVDDLRVTDLKARADAIVPCLFWSADGKAFFAAESNGLIRRVALDGFVEELRWETGAPIAWLSPSAEGLVLTAAGRHEAWVLDPGTFALKRTIAVPSAVRVVSAPGLSVAFGANRGGTELSVVDLKAGEVARQYDARSFDGVDAGFDKLAVTPDGKYLLAQGGAESLIRYAIRGDELEFEESSPRIAQNGQSVQVSPDSYYVALPSGGGNYEAGPYGTFIFKVADLARPEITIKQGAHPRTIGFDTKAGFIYAQNGQDWLILFRPSGAEAKSYPTAGRRGRAGETRQFAVHPDGGKLLVLGGSTLSFVELPRVKDRGDLP